jgi:drug/metabolite transporter (DMT)-like permease
VVVPFAAYAIQRARTGLGEGIGVALAFVGLVLFNLDVGFSVRSGDLWTLGCAVAFAIQIVYTNIAAKRSDPMVVTVVQLAFTSVTSWILVAARGGFSTPIAAMPWRDIIYLAVVATAFVLALQTWALGRTSPVRAGIIFATEPIFAAVFAALFFAERMSAREVIAGGTILFAVLVTELWGPAGRWLAGRGRLARANEGGS